MGIIRIATSACRQRRSRMGWDAIVKLSAIAAVVTALVLSLSVATWAQSINEIRTNQIGDQDDEYFEIAGSAGASLDTLTYLVLGDSPGGGTGVVEAVVSLAGLSIPDDGFFLAAEVTFGAPGTAFAGIVPDATLFINFENRQNRTHLLVDGFFGALNDDLDTDDDGTLDALPWMDVISAVGIVEEPDTTLPGVDQLYAALFGGVNVGPTNTGVAPGHLYRLPDENGGWVIGNFSLDPNTDDTPGSTNGSLKRYTCNFVDSLIAEIVAGTHSIQFDIDNDGDVDGDDLTAWRVEAGAVLTASGNPIQLGDTSLDGTVDGLDFINWNEHKFTATAAWCAGDFNADGVVDGLDYILWNENKFTSAESHFVPELGSSTLLWGLLVCWLFKARRQAL
jgi:hypothetical protein